MVVQLMVKINKTLSQSCVCGSVAEWLGSRAYDQQVKQVTSSTPGRHAAECNSGQVVYTGSPVTKQYN